MKYILCSLLLLTGCQTMVKGTSQDITVITYPRGAECSVTREDKEIAHIDETPATIKIEKSKRDITISCTKKGYKPETYLNKAGEEDKGTANILSGGLIGWGVDSATGAINKYEPVVTITLTRK